MATASPRRLTAISCNWSKWAMSISLRNTRKGRRRQLCTLGQRTNLVPNKQPREKCSTSRLREANFQSLEGISGSGIDWSFTITSDTIVRPCLGATCVAGKYRSEGRALFLGQVVRMINDHYLYGTPAPFQLSPFESM
jgi:hypothetical protein